MRAKLCKCGSLAFVTEQQWFCRQKQYFEQRKRQQQQQDAIFTENNVEGLVSCDHQKQNRSLDISSLLNVPKVTGECKPSSGLPSMTNNAACGSSIKELDSSHVKKSEGNAFPASYHTSMSIPTIVTDEFTASECTVPTGIRSSLQPVGRASSKSPRGNISTGKGREPEYFKSDSSSQLSIFDIIGDDGTIGTAEEGGVQEAHVAFSVEGLGKVGIETPMQSPQHPRSTLNGEQSSITKDAKNFSKRKIFNTMLDDLEMEVECLMQDNDLPSHHRRLSFNSVEPELLIFKDGMQLDNKQCKMKSLYDDDRHDNFLNDSFSHLLDYQTNEKCGVSWKRYDATNSSLWGNGSSDFEFGKYHSSPLDPLPRYSFVHDNYLQDDLFPIKLEGTRDNLTSFSGESCSSTAVGGESTADMSSARRSRRYGKGLYIPSKSNLKPAYDEGMWNIRASTLTQDEEYDTSRKHVRSNLSHSKSALFSRVHVNEYEDYQLFEEDFSSKVNPQPGPFCAPFENKQHSRVDSFGLDTRTDFHISDCCFDDFENDTLNEFSSENFALNQSFRSRQSYNTSFISKPVIGENSCEVFGDTESAFPAPELSAQGSATEEGIDRPKSEPLHPENKNTTSESRLPNADTTLKDHGYSGSHNMNTIATSQEVIAHDVEPYTEETSLSIKFQHDSDDELNTPPKELQGSIPVLYQQKVKGRDADDDLKGREPKATLIDPCYQIMTVERYVLKLFSVPKGKAAVWNAVKLF